MVNKKKKTPYAALAENFGPLAPYPSFVSAVLCSSPLRASTNLQRKKVMRSLQHVRCLKGEEKKKGK